MGIAADEERAGGCLLSAVFTDSLCDGHNVIFGEAAVEGGAPVAGCAEGNSLGGIIYVGFGFVVECDEFCNIGEGFGVDRLSGVWMHVVSFVMDLRWAFLARSTQRLNSDCGKSRGFIV